MEVLLTGYLLGTLAGIILGVLYGTLDWLRDFGDPFLAFANAVPRIILIPLLIVWFGFGLTPKIVLVIGVIVILVMLNVSSGIREVRADLIDNARLIGANRLNLLMHVYVPSVALWIFSTARVTVGFAFNAAVAAEFIGSSQGLGYLIQFGQETFEAAQVFAAITCIIVIAIILDLLLAAVEKHATRWMPTR